MSEFIIVVDVDNKRASAAYIKGLSDLELIWPQILCYSCKKDKILSESRSQIQDEYDAEMAEYKSKTDDYSRRFAAYNNGGFFRGARPPIEYIHRPRPPAELFTNRSYCSRYESIRAELKRMADLSGAALGPYRMTEMQVGEMIAWEDGSRIDMIKQEIYRD